MTTQIGNVLAARMLLQIGNTYCWLSIVLLLMGIILTLHRLLICTTKNIWLSTIPICFQQKLKQWGIFFFFKLLSGAILVMKKEHTKQILETVFNYYRLYSENNYRHTFIYKAILQRKRSVSQNRAATKKKKKSSKTNTCTCVPSYL